MSSFSDFLACARELISPDAVNVDGSTLARAGHATFSTTTRPLAILRVSNVSQLSTLVRLCSAHGVGYHPYSAGFNWGLGSRVPRRDAVLLDLSAMDKIRDYGPVHGSLTVEPGVTFRQAHDFLVSQASRFWLAPAGGTANASVLANAHERGDGSGPLADRCPHSSGFEVVLPNGEVLRTGFSRFGDTGVAKVAKEGVGPSLDGLFSQGELGIVTAMTIWLAPVPAASQRAAVELQGTAALGGALDALAEAMRRGLLTPGSWTLWNVYKRLALSGRYPWGRTAGAVPLDQRFIGAAGVPSSAPWYLDVTACGADVSLLEAVRQRVNTLLPGNRHWDAPVTATDIRDFARAEPSTESLATVYWRKRSNRPADPDPQRDGCGLIWICVKGCADGTTAEPLVRAQELAMHHGFELHTALSAMSTRALNVYAAIVYDRDIEGEDARAEACHAALVEHFRVCDMPLYRPSRLAEPFAHLRERVHDAAVDAIRAAFAGPFAPGRLVEPTSVLSPPKLVHSGDFT
jgi:4-cresol dehydrogenase (hydroxylating)